MSHEFGRSEHLLTREPWRGVSVSARYISSFAASRCFKYLAQAGTACISVAKSEFSLFQVLALAEIQPA